MKPALKGLHDDAVEKEEQLKELGATNERLTSRMDEEEACGRLELNRECWMVELVSCGLIPWLKRRVGQIR